jgi:hypothetical protein
VDTAIDGNVERRNPAGKVTLEPYCIKLALPAFEIQLRLLPAICFGNLRTYVGKRRPKIDLYG